MGENRRKAASRVKIVVVRARAERAVQNLEFGQGAEGIIMTVESGWNGPVLVLGGEPISDF